MGRPHKCPYCGATRNTGKGYRYNKSGKVRIRKCKDCGRRWTVGPAPSPEAAPEPTSQETPSPEPSINIGFTGGSDGYG